MSRSPFASRRALLAGAGSLFAWGYAPRLASAARRDPRLLVVILRGGLDGLAAVPALGDPDFDSARLAPELREAGATLPLDGFFAINRNMPALAQLYQDRQALILHAVASPYRDRSHFDAQDLLESGLPKLVDGGRSGWLNRVLAGLPRGERLPPPKGLAIAPTIPVILQGGAPVETWQRQAFAYADDDTVARLLDLYEARDPKLAAALRDGVLLDNVTMAEDGMAPGRTAGRLDFATDAAGAARIMARPDGPRIGAMAFSGWDTHADQGSITGGLGKRLAALDAAIGAFRSGLGPVWEDTVVAVVTEFGRTVRLNGSRGTDHGTATTAFLIGGAVKGGRVLADWPGLGQQQLREGRDLAPTTDLRAVMKGILAEHLGIGDAALGGTVFPQSEALVRLRGLCG
ncbi:MAG: hypothetical protein JWP04_3165 [Belnapia sp.]|nr:hypothetical protein [Belnapia sp.]